MANKAMRSSDTRHTDFLREDTTTARPRPINEQASTNELGDTGLSMDADQLGERFLLEATDQGNFESEEAGALDDRSITEGAPTDDALSDASFDPTRDIWESTVALASEHESIDGAVMLEGRAPAEDDSEVRGTRGAHTRETVRPVILTENVVREASLFDQVESEDENDTFSPEVDTDDVGHHAKSAARRAPSAR